MTCRSTCGARLRGRRSRQRATAWRRGCASAWCAARGARLWEVLAALSGLLSDAWFSTCSQQWLRRSWCHCCCTMPQIAGHGRSCIHVADMAQPHQRSHRLTRSYSRCNAAGLRSLETADRDASAAHADTPVVVAFRKPLGLTGRIWLYRTRVRVRRITFHRDDEASATVLHDEEALVSIWQISLSAASCTAAIMLAAAACSFRMDYSCNVEVENPSAIHDRVHVSPSCAATFLNPFTAERSVCTT